MIIRLSSIGDVVLTTPVIRCVKQQIPNAEVHFITKKNFRIVIENNPFVDHIIQIEKDVKEVETQLRNEEYDVVIDLHKNWRSHTIKHLTNANKVYSFDKKNIEKWLYVNTKINLLKPAKSIVTRYFEELTDLHIKDDGKGLDFYIDKKNEVNTLDAFGMNANEFIALNIGAQHKTKQLPLHKLYELIALQPYAVVILGGNDVKSIAVKLQEKFPEKVIDATSIYNLQQSASIVSQSAYVISHDSGLMHIAAAFQKKIYSIWGNTTPYLGFAPYYGSANIDQNTSIENNNINCRPCSKIGYNTCPRTHFNCMNTLIFSEIFK